MSEKNFLLFLFNVILSANAAHVNLMKIFECPSIDSPIPDISGFFNCMALDDQCVLRHKENLSMLEAMKNMDCTKSTYNTKLLLLEEDLLLAVLSEADAGTLLEKFVCILPKGGIGPNIHNFKAIAKPKMFFRKISCSIDLVKKLLHPETVQQIRAHIDRSDLQNLDSRTSELFFAYFIPKVFEGIIATNQPYLTNNELSQLFELVLSKYPNKVEEAVEFAMSLFSGPFPEPLRGDVDDQGFYKDFNTNDEKTFVHVCQSVRNNFILLLEHKKGKENPIELLMARIVEECDKIVNSHQKPRILESLNIESLDNESMDQTDSVSQAPDLNQINIQYGETIVILIVVLAIMTIILSSLLARFCLEKKRGLRNEFEIDFYHKKDLFQ